MGIKKWFAQNLISNEPIIGELQENTRKENEFTPIASEEDIKNCFRLILGRNPNPEEWKGHSSLAGMDLSEVVSSYLNSLEFKSRNLLDYDENIKKCKTTFGFDIYVNSKDPLIGKPISHGGVYEEYLTHTFLRYLKKNMTFLDIGANIGWYSLLTAHSLQDKCNIYAFEPFAFNSKLLLASKAENNFYNINVIQAAAGDELGTVRFGAVGSNGECQKLTNNVESILKSDTVNMIKIDDIITEKVDVIKIDIEGGEYNAMKGSINTIKESLPLIFSEFTPTSMPRTSGVKWDEFLKLMINLGYKIKIVDQQLIECGQDINKVFKIYKQTEKDHIDLVFYMED